MDTQILFPFAEYYWFYLGFTVFVLMMLALDLGVFHRNAHEVSFKEATTWSVVWVSLALLFNVGFYYYAASSFPADVPWTKSLEFLTGYIVEVSLSVDNIFVFVMVFAYFAVPAKYQHRVLFYKSRHPSGIACRAYDSRERAKSAACRPDTGPLRRRKLARRPILRHCDHRYTARDLIIIHTATS